MEVRDFILEANMIMWNILFDVLDKPKIHQQWYEDKGKEYNVFLPDGSIARYYLSRLSSFSPVVLVDNDKDSNKELVARINNLFNSKMSETGLYEELNYIK